MTDRIATFEQMLLADPDNTMVMFGLAKEYEKVGQSPRSDQDAGTIISLKLMMKAMRMEPSRRLTKRPASARKRSRHTRKGSMSRWHMAILLWRMSIV